jgi:hypothetical protein
MVVVVPLLAFVLLAYANGGVVPNPSAVSVEEGGKMCLDTDGDEVCGRNGPELADMAGLIGEAVGHPETPDCPKVPQGGDVCSLPMLPL